MLENVSSNKVLRLLLRQFGCFAFVSKIVLYGKFFQSSSKSSKLYVLFPKQFISKSLSFSHLYKEFELKPIPFSKVQAKTFVICSTLHKLFCEKLK
jgi:hypothetical protein